MHEVMETKIFYYSFSGNNRRVARVIGDAFEVEPIEIREQRKRTPFSMLIDLVIERHPRIEMPRVRLTGDERVILIAPVWNWKIAAPMRTFIKQMRQHLRNYWVVCVCGGRPGQQERLMHQYTRFVGRPPRGLLQLPIEDLVPVERRDAVKDLTEYRITDVDLPIFACAAQPLLDDVRSTPTPLELQIQRAENEGMTMHVA